jgi:hypothetical protein
MTLRFTVAGTPGAIVLGGQLGSGTALTQAMANTWLGNAWSKLKQPAVPDVILTGATVRDLRVVNGNQFEAISDTLPPGQTPGSLALAGAAVLVKWQTGTGGRTGRGRTFLPGVSEAQINTDGKTLTTQARTDWQAAATQYLGLMNAAGSPILAAVISRKDQVARPILASSLGGIVAFQRRRMR